MHTHAFPLRKQQDGLLTQFCRTLPIQEFCLHCWCVSTRLVEFSVRTSIGLLSLFDFFIVIYWNLAYLLWCGTLIIIVSSEHSVVPLELYRGSYNKGIKLTLFLVSQLHILPCPKWCATSLRTAVASFSSCSLVSPCQIFAISQIVSSVTIPL